MAKKRDFSRKIIKILTEKQAIPVNEIESRTSPQPSPYQGEGETRNAKYAFFRTLKGLEESGLIEYIDSYHEKYIRLTKDGKKRAHSINLDNENALINTTWDGYWRIILLDLPENRKSEREALRYLLKKAGFALVKNSVWVSMYPYEHLFTNIKKDLGLTTEMMIMVTDKIDEETENELLRIFRK